MITKEEVQDKLQIFAFSRGFAKGAIWARDQNAARIAELEAQKEELIKLLERIQLSVQNPYVSLPDFEYNSITEMLHKYPPKKNA